MVMRRERRRTPTRRLVDAVVEMLKAHDLDPGQGIPENLLAEAQSRIRNGATALEAVEAIAADKKGGRR